MFLIDSLLISGLRWTLDTIRTAADAEMHDDTVLRERLLEAEMQRELGEITGDEFRAIEADLLDRIRRVRHAARGGTHALTVEGGAIGRSAHETLTVEASVAGDFHDAAGPDGSADRPRPVTRPRARRALRSGPRTRGRR